jgi:hypothetical protein
MNKHNVSVQALTNPSSINWDGSISPVDPKQPPRLIVLIPADADYSTVTRRIWRLAIETDSDVQLLGLGKDTTQELALRRDLATMAALIRDTKVFVDTKVEIGNNWLNAVKHNYQDGDMIVCLAEQSTGIRQKPLSQVLESKFKAPVYILSDIRSSRPHSNVFSQVIAWSGCIGIIAGSFIVQSKIIQLPDDWFRTVLSIVLLIPELWLLWAWNSLFP